MGSHFLMRDTKAVQLIKSEMSFLSSHFDAVMSLGEIAGRIKNMITAAQKFIPVKSVKADAKPIDGKTTLRIGLTLAVRTFLSISCMA